MDRNEYNISYAQNANAKDLNNALTRIADSGDILRPCHNLALIPSMSVACIFHYECLVQANVKKNQLLASMGLYVAWWSWALGALDSAIADERRVLKSCEPGRLSISRTVALSR